jgi:hypothetical protein
MRYAYCFCSAGLEKWVACLKMRNRAIEIDQMAADPETIIAKVWNVILPTIGTIAGKKAHISI